MPPLPETHDLIRSIREMKSGGVFSPYIDFMVFPRYRRILPGQRIDFSFPLTVLVGRNGTGKSSVLHALYGAPLDQNVAHYWFGTAVDPVVDRPEDPQEGTGPGGKKQLAKEQKAAFWYGYRDGDVDRQAIKQRVRRESAKAFEDQENWEPTRPNESYGMTPIPREEGGKRARHPQIRMTVRYLNLRYTLSAFDRCFNFWSEFGTKRFRDTKRWETIGHGAKPKVQDYIRSRAIRLSKAFGLDGPYKIGTASFAEKPITLTGSELALVSRIVDKKYISGVLLNHRLYDDAWAPSVRFVTASGEYTEANAGSGETSVVQLVRLFESAEPNSLLLLDEPETSLHPGAQRELLRYILEQISKKRLQVVLSTHAPALIQELPSDAIKVMRRQPDGLVAIDQGLSSEEAFFEIGHPFDAKCNVIVEDVLAKAVLDAVAETRGKGFQAKLRIEFRPGGDSKMKQDIATFMHGSHRPVFVFDGDKVVKEEGDDGTSSPRPHTDPGDIALNLQNAQHMDDVIKKQVGTDVVFQQNSNMPAADKAALRVMYLKYYLGRVFYLPFRSPEEAIWDEDVCRKLLVVAFVDDAAEVSSHQKLIARQPDYKKKFDLLAKAIGGPGFHPRETHQMFLTRFIRAKNSDFLAVSNLLTQVVAATEGGHA